MFSDRFFLSLRISTKGLVYLLCVIADDITPNIIAAMVHSFA